jgi:hypothetical protein
VVSSRDGLPLTVTQEILAVVAANVHAQQERSDGKDRVSRQIIQTYVKPAAQHKTVCEWMTTLNFFQRQADLYNTRQPGTGEWLLSDSKFKAWESNPGSILWCRGMRMSPRIAGCIVY